MLYCICYCTGLIYTRKMFRMILLCFTLPFALMSSNDEEKETLQSEISSSDVADYRRHCLSQLDSGVSVFDVLPGSGFDNLLNKDMEMVFAPSYSECKITEDGKFLLPDNVFLIPVRQSELDESAELINHWRNFTSATSKSINVHAGLSYGGYGISGRFADDFIKTKSTQVLEKTFTTRMQLRYIPYRAKIQPTASLHPNFKECLIKIANCLQWNDTANARYESEMLVRVYGTHVVTSMDAGAAIVQQDFISKDLVLQDEATKREILAAAGVNFYILAHIGVTYKTSVSQDMYDSYETSKTSSVIKTYGGSIFMFANFTAGTDLAQKLDTRLVAIDRSGEPLNYLIKTENLPELAPYLVGQVSDYVKNAIEDYYEYNTYRGCTDDDSPNFSFQANLDDGNCKPHLTNLTFGGIYQTCEMEPGATAGDLCGKSREPNPKTGTYSCPSGYRTIELHTNVLTNTYSSRSCYFCWKIFVKCCKTKNHFSKASVNTYWCAAEGPVPQDSGYLFGGMYSSKSDNQLTGDQSCPDAFYARKLGLYAYICISDDYEHGYESSIPFGGLFSCNTGNPLAKSDEATTAWPKKCPGGFSMHLAIIDQGCGIHYCIAAHAGTVPTKGLPAIRRPPFSVKVPFTDLIPAANASVSDTEPLDAAAVSTISVFGILLCAGVVLALVLLVKRKRKSQTSYGTLGNEGTESNVTA